MRKEFTDGTLSLRPFRSGDADSLHAATRESVKELTQWLRWSNPKFSLQDSVAWIKQAQRLWRQRQTFNFGIFDPRDGRLLGSIWLSQINHKHQYANVGYWVRTGCTRRGIATASVRLIAEFGFEEVGLNRLEILAAVGNKASRRVARKVDARREGVLRQRLLLQERFHDAVMFSLLRQDAKSSGPGRERTSKS